MVTALAFYFFSLILVVSAGLVIFARSPVHAVLFLIICFFNAACLFVLLGAEFLAFILAIIYVGAVAVLFLFVVMMLDIGTEQVREKARQYVPVGLLVGGILLIELIAVFVGWQFAPDVAANFDVPLSAFADDVGNTEALGMVLYTEYVFAFQLAGLVLLVAMIGAIVLSLRTRSGVHKQSVAAQLARKREDVLDVVKVTPGTGV